MRDTSFSEDIILFLLVPAVNPHAKEQWCNWDSNKALYINSFTFMTSYTEIYLR